ncbi:MAG: hypothetical protein GY874_20395 [Desulfobacteraceae bacterium]|nr:hypothetical protein [Desulfobacteraceae bacterium]
MYLSPIQKSSPVPKSILYLLVFVWTIVFLLAGLEQVHADSPYDTYLWVAKQMNIKTIPQMPEIRFVGKKELQKAFIKGNKESYMRWETEFGHIQAQKIMDRYLKVVVGLFIPKTETVYICNTLSPCRRAAVLAHEMCHFFQHIAHGVIDPNEYEADALHMVREKQAYKIEGQYQDSFCNAK